METSEELTDDRTSASRVDSFNLQHTHPSSASQVRVCSNGDWHSLASCVEPCVTRGVAGFGKKYC